ncbi:MAG: hypothetical protein ACJAR2_002763 [Ilumatobacter sp.]
MYGACEVSVPLRAGHLFKEAIMATVEKKGHAEKLAASFAAQMTEEEALAILADYDAPIPD